MQIADGERLALDTSSLLCYLNTWEEASPGAHAIIDGLVVTGRCDAVISTATVAELLVQPIRLGRAVVDRLIGFLDSLDDLRIRDADFLVAAEAARIRAETGIGMPDAVVIATAVLTSSQVLVTNDRRQAEAARRAAPELRVVVLSEVAAVSSSA
ncbi:MAG: type II toxin-antitoxin system VapC family toxin [Chloroflexota bacterium]